MSKTRTLFGTSLFVLAALAGLIVWTGCEQFVEKAATDVKKEVAGETELEDALSDPAVTEIDITDNINGGETLMVEVKGDKTIYIPGGKETDIKSLKLAEGSHVTIKNADKQPVSGGQSVRAATDWVAEGWAILVIWNYFEIPDGATFDLIGKVRLIFRSTAETVQVDGKLTADKDGEIAVGKTGEGDSAEAPKITGSGTVTVGDEEVKKADEEAKDIGKEVPYTPPDSVAVTGVSLDKASLALKSGDTATLTATVAPNNAKDQAVTWASSNTAVATVANGKVTAKSAGTATITVTTVDGGKTATCTVTVTVSIPITVGGVTYMLKSVPGGTVTAKVGRDDGPFGNAGTTPVTVNAFSIGETEITYELWKAVYDWATAEAREAKKYTFANPGRQGGVSGSGSEPVGTNQHPVTTVSWRDVVVWCNAYSEAAGKTPVYYLEGTTNFGDTAKVLRESDSSSGSEGNGKAEKAVINANASGFRLPTEAEWEYAARGGVPSTTTPWTYTYAGTSDENSLGNYAWYYSNAGDATHPVGTKTANTAGLHDMSGNVWEWCWDIRSGTYRVYRGGDWFFNSVSNCTVAFRNFAYPDHSGAGIGFRVVYNGN